MADNKELITSAASRLLRIGGLAGRVGASMAGNTLANLFRDLETRDDHRAGTLLKNALRIKDLLGELKGVPMKIGQMISLHENLFPPEVVEVLKSLQQNAPPVPFADLRALVEQELGPRFSLIRHIDETPLAAASIGQVHRAVLANGAPVALKIQYPGIDDVIRADLKSLKGLLKILFSMFSRMDMEPVWQELKDRLMEELDYEKEAATIKRMTALYADDPRIIIPKVIDEVTSRHVLGMELVCGISPDAISEGTCSQELKNTWGQLLLHLILKGLFRYRHLHADPNLANFAFLPDGRLIVYDFGCVKEVPAALRDGYTRLVRAFLNHHYADIPDILKSMGVHNADGTPMPREMADDFLHLLETLFDPDAHYTFGSDHTFYARLYALGNKHISQSMAMVFPKDIVFIDRTFAGHFGNLCRLNARADWHNLLASYVDHPEKEIQQAPKNRHPQKRKHHG